ncbi:MAG TPA: FAD binding domain-containing protein, partial [Chitinophagaceae bacterium]|nr:FAD binding domain-containing protein [Chitinophagaceae bacterium]
GSGCGALKGYNRMHAIFGASDKCIAVQPSDMSVALAALDATVMVSSSKGERKIPFTDFHRLPGDIPEKDNNLQPGELITAIHVPVNSFNKNHYLKIRDRASYAFALVSVAVALKVNGNIIQSARLAMGGVAHKPWRLKQAEEMLTGSAIHDLSFAKLTDNIMQDAKTYEHNAFKIKLGKAAIAEAINKALQ